MSIPTLHALFDKLGIERKSMRWQQCEIVDDQSRAADVTGSKGDLFTGAQLRQ